MKLLVYVLNEQVIMLVDSGSCQSSFSFGSLGIVCFSKELKCSPKLVANGQVITCTHELPHCKVTLQGHSFTLNLENLPLQCYDVILGINWLASHSTMEIHWQDKWLAFNDNNRKIVLQGHQSDTLASQFWTTFQFLIYIIWLPWMNCGAS